ncbi:hypothetical protein VII00023_22939 [Vibrio ichthyoenteri ATCC 700023]|uniref:Uncharacterized protein n=1 Tax=Vibrio ichthyoenteri ATCC 700023 TaxID=870968 RepID=F9S7J3_9VIBR|nr:hypothetical protein [Vibrio ichthyoenteri]EGU31289.1 hypothetical protein VII00023_22939 [Vibrio ichthyoenteri ATCC 700023]
MESTTTITAHQLVVGMTIRCPVEGNKITITDLIAHTENIALGCDKGYTGVAFTDTFELLEPFDLTECNLNWINEQLD